MERISHGAVELRRVLSFALALVVFAGWVGCGKEAVDSVVRESGPKGRVEGNVVSPLLTDVNASLQSGAFDNAAARLLELQASGREFTPREAADYRKALNEAYARALEAAEKGDLRAEAALRMIREARPH